MWECLRAYLESPVNTYDCYNSARAAQVCVIFCSMFEDASMFTTFVHSVRLPKKKLHKMGPYRRFILKCSSSSEHNSK